MAGRIRGAHVPRPGGGSHASSTETTRISIMPIQKYGPAGATTDKALARGAGALTRWWASLRTPYWSIARRAEYSTGVPIAGDAGLLRPDAPARVSALRRCFHDSLCRRALGSAHRAGRVAVPVDAGGGPEARRNAGDAG